MSPPPASLLAVQQEIQRKVGRNLLRLQQCEVLMKRLAAEHNFAGPVTEVHDIKAKNRDLVSKKTMGQVVGHLTDSLLQVATASPEPDEDDEPPPDATLPWFRTSFRISFSEDDFKRVERKLAGLVETRNELVHHFLEMFDLSSSDGCQAANTYLDEHLQQVDASHEELRQWAEQAATTKTLHANVMNTPEVTDLLVHGILPNGAGVDWSYSTIVNLLRDAEIVLNEGGWTSLARAIDHIHKTEPEHIPKKYGCSSWRHLLHECKQFEVRKHQPAAGLPTEIWYRSHS